MCSPELLNQIFEKRLFLWIVATTDENGFMLGGDFIKEKAKEIAKELDITDHKFSDSWLQGLRCKDVMVKNGPTGYSDRYWSLYSK